MWISIWQYYTIVMQQQLIVNTIQILPATMDDVLYRLQTLLSAPAMQETVLSNIVKSLFFGLWNFDKMINQHNLSTRIAELLLKVPKKNALVFLKALLAHIHQKWNLIDHHRINKFMQLVRYLLANAFKYCQKYKINKKKIDQILMDTVYDDKLIQNGLVFHITDIYFQVCEENLVNGTALEDLGLFQSLLTKQPSQHMRLYIIEHIYEKYKEKLIASEPDLEKLDTKLQEFAAHFLVLARKEEKELHRKNLYAIVGYAKSEHVSFSIYMTEKRAKALAQEEKKKKKMTKSKVKEIKELKKKRKDKKKIGKKKDHKIMSVRKFQDKKGKFKKGIEEL